MANNTHNVLRDINDNEIDFKSPIDEDLMGRLVNNLFSIAGMVDGQSNTRFEAQANGTPTDGGTTSVLTLDTITQGVFERDDQYNTKYIEVTSGTASGKGLLSRFVVNSCDEGALTFTVNENTAGDNLNEAGMVDDDTFKIIGHTHDGIDGEVVRFDQRGDMFQYTAVVLDDDGVDPNYYDIPHGLGSIPKFVKIRGQVIAENNTFNGDTTFHAMYDVLADIANTEGEPDLVTYGGYASTNSKRPNGNNARITNGLGALYAVGFAYTEANFALTGAGNANAVMNIIAVTDTYIRVGTPGSETTPSTGWGHHFIDFEIEVF